MAESQKQKGTNPQKLAQTVQAHLTATCEVKPATIHSGEVVTLWIYPGGDPQNFGYVWFIEGDHPVETLEEKNYGNVHIVRFATKGLSDGQYTIRVTISDNRSSPLQTKDCDATLTVVPLSLSDLKYNFDQKMDHMSTGVDKVATGVEQVADSVGKVAERLGGPTTVNLQRTANAKTEDLPLWVVIQKTTDAISFDNYSKFMDLVLCGIGETSPPRVRADQQQFDQLRKRRFLPYNDVDAYRLLKVATEAFLMVNCGVSLAQFTFTQADLDELIGRVSLVDGQGLDLNTFNNLWLNYLELVNGGPDATLPYLALVRAKLKDAGLKTSIFAAEDPSIDLPQECVGILRRKLTNPCLLELIWSYWHEEAMLVQTLNVISRRFQNVRGSGERDPLAMLEIDPLRPLNNLLWGYLQDEQHRLSVPRRVYEYDHHYGLSLYGKAVPQLRPADSRSKFLEAFHNLLHLTIVFFQQDDDTTVIADGFPLINALREVHFLLAEGAHNQFGDLPSTARQEMLLQQWLLARPEFREFIPTRIMVAYPEPWMDRVDAMKTLQNWTDISVFHFNQLAVFGEQILLSIRFGAWSDPRVSREPAQAANWARFWRGQIKGYIHAYRAVTGVDLTAEPTDPQAPGERYLQPSVHLRKRLAMQQKRV
jgi:hypothetical protein